MKLSRFLTILITVFVCSTAYAEYPSWDKQIKNGRFVVLPAFKNEAVLDKETGLVWELSPHDGEVDFFAASIRCINLAKGNRWGWRLPTIQELSTLIDPTQDPPLPAGYPFQNVQDDHYWSATRSAHDLDTAFIIKFAGAGILGRQSLFDDGLSWCVRGGQGTDIQ